MNVNKAIVCGNLTRDPESRALPSGQELSSFSIATNRAWNDQDGNKQEQVEFHNVVAFGKLAEICNQYLSKGRLIYLEGRLQTRSWETPEGVKKYRTEIVAENMQMGPRSAVSETPNVPKPEIAEEKSEENDSDNKDEIKIEDIPF